MNDEIPFMAVGNDELLDAVKINKGDVVEYTHPTGEKEQAVIKLGKNSNTGEESPLLQYITLKNTQSIIVGIGGKMMAGGAVKLVRDK